MEVKAQPTHLPRFQNNWSAGPKAGSALWRRVVRWTGGALTGTFSNWPRRHSEILWRHFWTWMTHNPGRRRCSGAAIALRNAGALVRPQAPAPRFRSADVVRVDFREIDWARPAARRVIWPSVASTTLTAAGRAYSAASASGGVQYRAVSDSKRSAATIAAFRMAFSFQPSGRASDCSFRPA